MFTIVVLLMAIGAAGAAHADCLVLCPPPSDEPAPGDPPSGPAPVPPPPAPVPAPPAPAPPPEDTVSPESAQRLLVLINRSRSEHGLRPMSHRSDVAAIAIDHSKAMAKAGDIWHNDSYFSAETKRRLGARTVGENVALNNNIDDAHARLMASPGHRANILNPVFVVAGIGVVKSGDTYYVTEDFLEPVAAAGPAPTPPAPRTERPRSLPASSTDAPAPPADATSPTTIEDPLTQLPDRFATTTSLPRRLQVGGGPSDASSALLFLAVVSLVLTATATGRRLVRRRSAATLI